MVTLSRAARAAAVIVTLLGALTAVGDRPARAQSGLVEVTFAEPGRTTGEWAVYLAQSRGFYKDEGISVTIIDTDGPTNTINQLATGAVNVAGVGTDNSIAAIARALPIKLVSSMFLPNPYTLVTLPTIKSWQDLKGKSVMLATKQDVTAIAFTAMAAQHGMKMDDFSIYLAGSTPARYAALTSGNAQGSILTQPLDLVAESNGMNRLATAGDAIKDWVFTGLNVNDAWAKANPQLAVKFLRAIHKAMIYGYTHKAETVASLVEAAKVDPAIATKAYDLDWTRWHAFDPSLKIPIAGINAVGAAQIQLGAIKEMPPLAALYDASYLNAATR
jgi:NitT/TauT family transport system substrate-binding protein